jgi:SprT-like family.
MTQATTREEWLMHAVNQLKPIFEEKGYVIPAIRISCGFPSSGARSSHIGECWSTESSESGINEIFIHPNQDGPVAVLDIITHELVHAIDNCKHRHDKEFREIALKVGLAGPMRMSSATPQLKEHLQNIAATLGPYPHGRMKIVRKLRPYKPRSHARCSECGYEIIPLKKWIHLGPPICPLDKIEMLPIGEWEDA